MKIEVTRSLKPHLINNTIDNFIVTLRDKNLRKKPMKTC